MKMRGIGHFQEDRPGYLMFLLLGLAEDAANEPGRGSPVALNNLVVPFADASIEAAKGLSDNWGQQISVYLIQPGFTLEPEPLKSVFLDLLHITTPCKQDMIYQIIYVFIA